MGTCEGARKKGHDHKFMVLRVSALTFPYSHARKFHERPKIYPASLKRWGDDYFGFGRTHFSGFSAIFTTWPNNLS